jgi:single-stranded DNA-binding protein
VCTMRLATHRLDGKDQGALIIDVVSFDRRAEAVAEHLAKGRQVAVTGRLESQDGSYHSKHEVVANWIELLSAGLEVTDITEHRLQASEAPDQFHPDVRRPPGRGPALHRRQSPGHRAADPRQGPPAEVAAGRPGMAVVDYL